MALETKDIEIDGMRFQIQQFTALKAMKVEKKIMSVLIPIVSPLISDMKDIDLEKIGVGVQAGLGSLSDDDFTSLVLETLSSTFVFNGGKPELITEQVFNYAFIGKILTVYKLIIEVMKVNKFCFFELLQGGIRIPQIISTKGK